MKRKGYLLAAALLLALSWSVVPVARAEEETPPPPEGRGGIVAGKVTAIEDSTLTLQTRRGEVEVITDAETVFHIPGTEEATLENVAVGDWVIAAGRWDESAFHARRVRVVRPQERRARLTGEVAAIEGTDLLLRVQGGRELLIHTDETTTFHVLGTEEATLADVHEGDRVVVGVETREDGTYARTVAVFPEDAARVGGQVVEIEGTALLIETQHGTVQVLTEGGTLFRIPGVEEAALSDLKVGDTVVCGGRWEGEATFRALAVVVPAGSQAPGRTTSIRGRVVGVGEDRLTVGTAQGPVTVLVGGETLIRVPGTEEATLSDLQIGDAVGVRGQWTEDGFLQAEAVVAGRPGQGAGRARPRGRFPRLNPGRGR